MAWMQRLVETYDNVKNTNALTEGEQPLVLAGFVRKTADIEVILTAEGTFAHANRIGKDQGKVVIPSTPEAEGRTSKAIRPYPLSDELQYVAGDFTGGDNLYFDAYLRALDDWCACADTPDTLRILRNYLAERRLARDMRDSGFAFDPDKDKKHFVMFSVQGGAAGVERLWESPAIRESWLACIGGRTGSRALCYVEGRVLPEMISHPKFQGNAKLISGDDTQTPFQYKGRFTSATEVVAVSYDASVKAHNTLGWLLRKQGFDRYGLKVVAWATNGSPLASPAGDNPLDFMSASNDYPQTFEAYGKALALAQAGLTHRIASFNTETTASVVIIGMEAATTGRMSINYYQEMPGNVYADRLLQWYNGCKWPMWRVNRKDKKQPPIHLIATPTPDEIAAAVLGQRNVNEACGDNQVKKSATKLVRQLRRRILKHTVEGTPLSRDIVWSAVRRASAPQSFTDKNGRWQEYEWRKTLAVACALVHRAQIDQQEEGADMLLDENNRDRSYLYGRLLALADMAEYSAMDKNAYRQTNAVRYMQIFQLRPFDTWTKLHNLILPYFGKLGKKSEWYKKLIGQVELLFNEDERESREPLKGTYLHGYYCQRQAFFTKNLNNKKIKEENDDDGADE